ncbi:peptidase S8 and S53 domain-containing protein [Tieghemostelium lacteum]|uniref:Peptidase S8 and S53 domain-containing protein n=1 Tax=Tieghemostelium lacteum TaxID=361077 RepID=A0A152A427_TIELA|nr:peptidase S8 and S53 domain-containing protein [Tieghemostelium lacteum]|eukprot:KYR00811.1 peptidase S8 and S53 domain-containing protein [Tieghemostelium lacteum]
MVEGIHHDQSVEVDLTIGIKQQNTKELEDFVMQVSQPDHQNYGKYLSFQEVKDMVSPEQESIEAVQNWLESEGVTNHYLTNSGDFIKASVSTGVAEKILDVKYHRFIHKQSKMSFIRSMDPYTVPDEVSKHIDFIGGVNHLPQMPESLPPKAKKSIEGLRFPFDYDFEGMANNRTDPFLSPHLIQRAMNVPSEVMGNCHEDNSQAIAQFLKEYFSSDDLEYFQKKFKLPRSHISRMVGFNEEDSPGIETALDIQYIMAMAPQAPTWIVSVSGLHEGQEPFLEWLVNISSMPNLPLVHSISYGDDENSIDRSYTERVDIEFKKYAAMGRTIVFSSGDSGVGCSETCDHYVPGWPASSSYVLSVGGVIMKRTADNHMIGHQISGGGFSNYFSRPAYQDNDVQYYLDNYVSDYQTRFFNSNGRGYPDISSFSRSVIIAHKGNLIPIGGTSASAPIIAGMLTLINNQRLYNSQPPIGFFNPLLYKIVREHPDAVYDIVDGENSFHCCDGFTSSPGWDPVTGWGVPNMRNLLKYTTQ